MSDDEYDIENLLVSFPLCDIMVSQVNLDEVRPERVQWSQR